MPQAEIHHDQNDEIAFYEKQLTQDIADARSPADLVIATRALEHLGWSKTHIAELKKTLRELDETLNPLLLSKIPEEYGLHECANALVERHKNERNYREQVRVGEIALRLEWNNDQGSFICVQTDITTNRSTILKLSEELGVAKTQFTAIEKLGVQRPDQRSTQKIPTIDLVESLKTEASRIEERGVKLLTQLRDLTKSDQISTSRLKKISAQAQEEFAHAKDLRESAIALLPSREVVITLEDQDVQIAVGQLEAKKMDRDEVIAEQKIARDHAEFVRRQRAMQELRTRLARATQEHQDRQDREKRAEDRAHGYDLETLLKKVATPPIIIDSAEEQHDEKISDEKREELEIIQNPEWQIPAKTPPEADDSTQTHETRLIELLDQKKEIEQLIKNTRPQLDIILTQVARDYRGTGLSEKLESLDPENTGTKKPSLMKRLRFAWISLRSGDKNYTHLEQQFKEIIKNRDETFPARLAAITLQIESITYTDADRKKLDARLTRVQKERLRRSPQLPEPQRGVKAR